MKFLKNLTYKFSNKKTVAVHDGPFHPDDVFAVATLELFLKKPVKVIRSRDDKVINSCDYVFDVGRIYDASKNRFDHHQETFFEKRENGIPYAAAGLAWKHFGEKISGSKEIFEKIDKKVIQSIDAEDNGVEIYKTIFEGIDPYQFGDFIHSMNPSFKENINDRLKMFTRAVFEAKRVLKREIDRAKHSLESQKIIEEAYKNSEDKRIIVLDDEYPNFNSVLQKYSEPLFVIRPIWANNNWGIKAVTATGFKFKNRLDFPENWRGLVNEELAKVSGISDAVFCHKSGFFAITKSKESAVKLAKLALSQKS